MDIIQAIIAFIVGAVTPLIIQMAKAKGWTLEGWQVQLITLAIAIATAIMAIVIAGKFDLANAVATISICLATTEVVYNQIIKKLLPIE